MDQAVLRDQPGGHKQAKLLLVCEQLRRGRAVRIRAWGASMEPAIPAGTELLLSPIEAPVRPGAVAAIQAGARLLVHRVLASGPDGSVLTQGDNQTLADGWQPASSVLGVADCPVLASPLLAWGLKFLVDSGGLEQATEGELAAFAKLIDLHGLAPWVGALLHRGSIQATWLPPELVVRARKAYRACALEGQRLVSLQQALVADFERAGIPMVTLKGFALALRLHGDLGARNQQDLDLLVHPRHARQAGAILAEHGFEPHTPRRLARWHLAWHYDQSWFNSDGDKIELHWDFTLPGTHRIDFDGVFARAARLSEHPGLGAVLAPEDNLAYLALHGALDDRCLNLRGLVELALLARFQDLDWDQVVERARAWRVARACWLSLSLAARVFEAPIPSDVLAALAPGPRSAGAWLRRLPLEIVAGRPPLNDPRWKALAWPTLLLPDHPEAQLRRIVVQAAKAGLRAFSKFTSIR